MKTFEEKLWSKVQKTNDCWVWIGALTSGYGQFAISGMPRKGAHKVMYELLVGEVPKGMQLDHLCRNRACVNPDHLEIVTPKENIHRSNSIMGINSRKTHCFRGHELKGYNLIKLKKGRSCRTCNNVRSLAFYHSKKNN